MRKLSKNQNDNDDKDDIDEDDEHPEASKKGIMITTMIGQYSSRTINYQE